MAAEATAGWRYTKWGMTQDEVAAASGGLAVPHVVEKRESWGVYADLVAPQRLGPYPYRAHFYFDSKDGGLEAVRLKPTGRYWCPDIVLVLRERYGSNRYLRDGYYYWHDESANNQISLSSFSTCRIKYEPLREVTR
jgi:hypothetical protein